MRELDRIAIQAFGIPAYTLMQRAGQALFAAITEQWPAARSVCVVCGAGNNGGDGYIVARLAREQGWQVAVVGVANPAGLLGDAARACQDYLASGGELLAFNGTLPVADVLVDALLGTGLTRTLEGDYAAVVKAMNAVSTPVVAADIPSGLQADTGQPCGCAVEADMTVTFIGMKQGLLTGQARTYVGVLRFAGLDVPAAVYARLPTDMQVIGLSEVQAALPPRPRCAHKGHFGHSLLVGGYAGMAGAIRLAGEAALRTGSGLVSVATHPAHAAWLNLTRPELMVQTIESAGDLRSVWAGKTVVGIGPGLGQTAWSRAVLVAVLGSGLPMVVDADGLNLLAGMPCQRGQWILTPHPAEAARLLAGTTAEVERDRVAAARRLQQQYGGVVVLKGAGTLVASADGVAFCTLGNPGMATAGMGDVLTGILTGLLAQGLGLGQAARVGVYLHAQAADRAAQGGERGLLAGDVIDHLCGVVNP